MQERNRPTIHPTPEEREQEERDQRLPDTESQSKRSAEASDPARRASRPWTPSPRTEEGTVESREPAPAWGRREPAAERQPAPAVVAAPQPALNAAQVIILTIGIFFVGMGSVGLSRGGFDDLNLPGQVMGIPHTPLLGFMELVFGAVVVLAAALPYAGKWVLAGAGAVLSLFGLLVVVTASSLNSALGVETLNGWLYLVCGLVIVAVGIVMPSMVSSSRRPS